MQLINRLGVVLILLIPIGTLAIKGWSNLFFFLSVIVSIVFLAKNQKLINKLDSWIWVFVFTFSAPVFVDIFMQFLRGEFFPPQLDAPFRLLLGIPILFFCLGKKVSNQFTFTFVTGMSVVATFTAIILDPIGIKVWERWATSSADPNSLGCITAIASGVLIYCFLRHLTAKQWLASLFALATLIIGLYVLLQSRSRGGWLVLLLLTPTILFLARKEGLKGWEFAVLSLISFVSYILFQDGIILARAQSIYIEIKDWLQNPNDATTSIGVRLNMLEASWTLISHRPLIGYGDHGYASVLSSGSLGHFAPLTIEGISATPHNEVLGKALRSGIFGGLASLLLFLMPLLFFYKLAKRSDSLCPNVPASLGIIIVSGFFISGLSAGILGLTYLSSLYAATVTSLTGLALSTYQLK